MDWLLICRLGFGVGILMQKHIKTAVVSNIFNPNGEVAAGVASVEAIVSCQYDSLILAV